MRPIHVGVAALAALAGAVRADVTYVFQNRLIVAETSANTNIQTIAAPNFGPFVEELNLQTEFPVQGGGTAVNTSRVGIDCQLDPNAVQVVGSLSGSGGLGVIGGTPTVVFGEAAVEVETRFIVSEPTPFRLISSPRPSTDPGDRFQLKLENVVTGFTFIDLDETMPAQAVNLNGILEPGQYSLEYEAELTVEGPEMLRNLLMHLRLGACYANCDETTGSKRLNANDFVCFLTRFVEGDLYANCDGSTSFPFLTASDFACFLQEYAAGCS